MGPWHRNYLGIFYRVTIASQNIKAKLGFSCSFFFLRSPWLCPVCCTGTWVPWEKGASGPRGKEAAALGAGWVGFELLVEGSPACSELGCCVLFQLNIFETVMLTDLSDVEFSTSQQWSAGWVSSHPHCEPSFLESLAAAEFLLVRRWCYAFRKLCIPTQEHQLVLDSRRHAKLLPKM